MADFENIRQMPHSLQAEQALLGSLIIEQNNISLTDTLSADSFYIDAHKVIYSSIRSLYSESRCIDLVTLIDKVKTSSEVKDFDFAKYIKTICDIAVENSNVAEYVRIIREKATLRDLINASKDISEKAFAETENVKELVDYAERTLLSVSDDKYRSGLVHISDVLKEVYASYQYKSAHPDEDNGMKTGFTDLDNYFVSLGEGDLVLVGARPGVGKTSFTLNLALNMGRLYPNKDIAIFSLEMSRAQLVNRLISCEALIDNYTIRKCTFTDEQWGTVALACSSLSSMGIYIDDTANISITEMKSKARRLDNLGCIIIDYLQLMRAETHTDNRVLEVADITRSLKLMAKEMEIPIILCSQLSRPMKGVKEKRPVVSDLRDSGAIEQDADIVMMLFKDEGDGEGEDNKTGNAPDISKQEVVECIIGKNRHGAQGTVKFAWHGQYFKFVALDDKYQDQ